MQSRKNLFTVLSVLLPVAIAFAQEPASNTNAAPAPHMVPAIKMSAGPDAGEMAAPEEEEVDDSHPEAVLDGALMGTLRTQLITMMEAGKTVPAATLRGQLKRKHHEIAELPSPASETLTPEQSYVQRRDSVVIIGGLYKCDECDNWHVISASAFKIAEPDIFVSNYHVFMSTNRVAFLGMTRDQQVMPVKEILAASKVMDIAIFRMPDEGVKSLALRTDAPVGTPVTVISHPAEHFYSMTQGAITRYSRNNHGGPMRLWMDISADYASGSSGGPVLDPQGNVVGMVDMTVPAFQDKKDFHSLHMVFKQCIPASSIRMLISPTAKQAAK